MAHDVVLMWNLESREVANPSLAGGGANGKNDGVASPLVAHFASRTVRTPSLLLCVSLPHLCFHVIMDARPPPAAPPLSRESQLAALQQQQARIARGIAASTATAGGPTQANSHLKSLPIRAYLDQTVVPILLDGMFIKKSLSFSA